MGIRAGADSGPAWVKRRAVLHPRPRRVWQGLRPGVTGALGVTRLCPMLAAFGLHAPGPSRHWTRENSYRLATARVPLWPASAIVEVATRLSPLRNDPACS